MNPVGILVTVVVIVVISAVVGAIAQFMNKVKDANAVNRRAVAANPRPAANAAPPAQQVEKDMDRFLAEIDRLRRKNNVPAAEPSRPAPPVVQPVRPPDRPRPRVVAEVAEPPRTPSSFPSAPPMSFPTALPAVSVPVVTRLADLPVATVITPTSGTGAQYATRVTAPPRRAAPAPKTDFGKAFAGLLSTGKGAALAVVLQEVMGPPKSKRKG